MKDTLVTVAMKRREIRIALCCLALAVLVNIGAIIAYRTPFYEVFTQIGFTVVIALAFYALSIVGRVLYLLCRRLFRKK